MKKILFLLILLICVSCSEETEIVEEKKVETPKITHISKKEIVEQEEIKNEEVNIEESDNDSPTTQNSQIHTYVLNTDSFLFHTPLCWHVDRMSEKNKKIVEKTRDEIISQGYTPCEHCNP